MKRVCNRRPDSPPSKASGAFLDEDRVRKVVAENPDVMHAVLARRFGITVHRLRVVIGWKGGGELPNRKMRFTPCLLGIAGMRARALAEGPAGVFTKATR